MAAEEFFGEAPQEDVFDPKGWEETPDYQEQEYTGEKPEEELRFDESAVEEDEYYEDDEGEYYEEGEEEEEYDETNPVMDYVSSLGYNVDGYQDDSSFLDDIAGSYQAAINRQQELQEQIEYLESLKEEDDDEEYYEDDGEYYESGVPDFDPQWAQLVEMGEGGRYVLRPEYIGTIDPVIAEKVNEYAEWREERSNALLNNPMDMILDDGLEDYIEARINHAIESNFEENTLNSQAEQFVAENASVLYLTNDDGELLYDPATQEPMLSPVGQALSDAHVALLEQGMEDPVARHNVAMQLVTSQFGGGQGEEYYEEGEDEEELLQGDENDYYKQQYEERPFEGMAETDYMPDGPSYPQAGIGLNGMPEHNSLGSLATQLAVHKGFLQPKG